MKHTIFLIISSKWIVGRSSPLWGYTVKITIHKGLDLLIIHMEVIIRKMVYCSMYVTICVPAFSLFHTFVAAIYCKVENVTIHWHCLSTWAYTWVGHVAALVRSHAIGLLPFRLTKEQTTQTMDPSPKTIELLHYPGQWNLELTGSCYSTDLGSQYRLSHK